MSSITQSSGVECMEQIDVRKLGDIEVTGRLSLLGILCAAYRFERGSDYFCWLVKSLCYQGGGNVTPSD